jgi:UDP-N-acetylmuramyl tripeptide synthase
MGRCTGPAAARSASLGCDLTAQVRYFGLEDTGQRLPEMPHAADSIYCPRCGALLDFELVYYGHLGRYRCPSCGFARPKPEFAARDLRLVVDGASHIMVNQLGLETGLPGLYNVYNVLAAAAAALTLGVSPAAVVDAVKSFAGAFGRTEIVEIDGKRLQLLLAKNPVGFNEVIRTLLLDPGPLHIYIALNDRIADGQDVSWIWDVDLEQLASRAETLVVGGTRAEDMAVRLKYAGFRADKLTVVQDHSAAIDQLLARTPAGATAYAVPTYTAMLDLRRTLARMGMVRQYWED